MCIHPDRPHCLSLDPASFLPGPHVNWRHILYLSVYRLIPLEHRLPEGKGSLPVCLCVPSTWNRPGRQQAFIHARPVNEWLRAWLECEWARLPRQGGKAVITLTWPCTLTSWHLQTQPGQWQAPRRKGILDKQGSRPILWLPREEGLRREHHGAAQWRWPCLVTPLSDVFERALGADLPHHLSHGVFGTFPPVGIKHSLQERIEDGHPALLIALNLNLWGWDNYKLRDCKPPAGSWWSLASSVHTEMSTCWDGREEFIRQKVVVKGAGRGGGAPGGAVCTGGTKRISHTLMGRRSAESSPEPSRVGSVVFSGSGKERKWLPLSASHSREHWPPRQWRLVLWVPALHFTHLLHGTRFGEFADQ